MDTEHITENDTKPKVSFILQDSEYKDIGLVIDCAGSVPGSLEQLMDHDKYEVIGSWQRLRCGIVVELTTTIEARQDVLINLLKELSMHNVDSKTPVLPIRERQYHYNVSHTKHHQKTPVQPSTEFDTKYDDLRSRLRNAGK